MNSPVWQLDQHGARLQLPQIAGRIDLSCPGDGLTELEFGAKTVENARLLAVRMPHLAQAAEEAVEGLSNAKVASLPPGEAETPTECYVRSTDLVAVYDESDRQPLHVEMRWRAVAPSESGGPLGVIELVVSVRTHLLNSRPKVSVESAVPAADVLRLSGRRSGQFEMLDRDRSCVLDPGCGAACLLFRLPHSDLSYAEMVHPADFFESRLQHDADSAPIARLSHQLFPSPLEKGVILLARVQGMLLRRGNDARVAAERYAAFAVAEPPLGT